MNLVIAPGELWTGRDGTRYRIVAINEVNPDQKRWWVARSVIGSYRDPFWKIGPRTPEDLHTRTPYPEADIVCALVLA